MSAGTYRDEATNHLCTWPGVNIWWAAEEAINTAKETGAAEVLVFNDVKIQVTADMTTDQVSSNYHHAMKRWSEGKWDPKSIMVSR